MEGFMPSEIARLVLGYLKESGCSQTWKLFLEESPHLLEYSQCLKEGKEYPTTIGGKNLKQMLQDYYILSMSDSSTSPDSKQLLGTLENAVAQAKQLLVTVPPRLPEQLSVGCIRRQTLQQRMCTRSHTAVSRSQNLSGCNAQRVSSTGTAVSVNEHDASASGVHFRQAGQDVTISIANALHTVEDTLGCHMNMPGVHCKIQNFQHCNEKSVLPQDLPVIHLEVPLTSHQNSETENSRSEFNVDTPVSSAPTLLHHLPNVAMQNQRHSFQDSITNTLETDRPLDRRLECTRTTTGGAGHFSDMQTTSLSHSTLKSGDQLHSLASNSTSKTDRTSMHCIQTSSSVNKIISDKQTVCLSSLQLSCTPSSVTKASSFHQESVCTDNLSQSSPCLSRHLNTTACSSLVTVSSDMHTVQNASNLSFFNGTFHSSSTCSAHGSSNLMQISSHRETSPSRELQDHHQNSNKSLPFTQHSDSPVSQSCSVQDSPSVQNHRNANASVNSTNQSVSQQSINCPVSVPNPSFSFPVGTVPSSESGYHSGQCQKEGSDNRTNSDSFTSGLSQQVEKMSPIIDTVPASLPITSASDAYIPISPQPMDVEPELSLSNRHEVLQINGNCYVVTPPNSSQPSLPSRHPDHSSPRYILAQQRSIIPSFTTPVKDDLPGIDDEFRSPRRKSHIPRRRLLAFPSPLTRPNSEAETHSEDSVDYGPLLEELINYSPLVEKLAENINKVVSTELSVQQPQIEPEPAQKSTEDSQNSLDTHVPDSLIKNILIRTESDPVFEEVLNFLCEKYDSSRDGTEASPSHEVSFSPSSQHQIRSGTEQLLTESSVQHPNDSHFSSITCSSSSICSDSIRPYSQELCKGTKSKAPPTAITQQNLESHFSPVCDAFNAANQEKAAQNEKQDQRKPVSNTHCIEIEERTDEATETNEKDSSKALSPLEVDIHDRESIELAHVHESYNEQPSDETLQCLSQQNSENLQADNSCETSLHLKNDLQHNVLDQANNLETTSVTQEANTIEQSKDTEDDGFNKTSVGEDCCHTETTEQRNETSEQCISNFPNDSSAVFISDSLSKLSVVSSKNNSSTVLFLPTCGSEPVNISLEGAQLCNELLPVSLSSNNEQTSIELSAEDCICAAQTLFSSEIPSNSITTMANSTLLVNATGFTPMKIAIPDFHFLTVSPNHLFGVPAYLTLESNKPDSLHTILPVQPNVTSAPPSLEERAEKQTHALCSYQAKRRTGVKLAKRNKKNEWAKKFAKQVPLQSSSKNTQLSLSSSCHEQNSLASQTPVCSKISTVTQVLQTPTSKEHNSASKTCESSDVTNQSKNHSPQLQSLINTARVLANKSNCRLSRSHVRALDFGPDANVAELSASGTIIPASSNISTNLISIPTNITSTSSVSTYYIPSTSDVNSSNMSSTTTNPESVHHIENSDTINQSEGPIVALHIIECGDDGTCQITATNVSHTQTDGPKNTFRNKQKNGGNFIQYRSNTSTCINSKATKGSAQNSGKNRSIRPRPSLSSSGVHANVQGLICESTKKMLNVPKLISNRVIRRNSTKNSCSDSKSRGCDSVLQPTLVNIGKNSDNEIAETLVSLASSIPSALTEKCPPTEHREDVSHPSNSRKSLCPTQENTQESFTESTKKKKRKNNAPLPKNKKRKLEARLLQGMDVEKFLSTLHYAAE